MITFDGIAKENIKEHNQNWPQNPDHLYKIFNNWRFWIWKKKCIT